MSKKKLTYTRGVGQSLLPILVGWTSICQLFWGSLGRYIVAHGRVGLEDLWEKFPDFQTGIPKLWRPLIWNIFHLLEDDWMEVSKLGVQNGVTIGKPISRDGQPWLEWFGYSPMDWKRSPICIYVCMYVCTYVRIDR